jgi:hypothetical protein
MELELDEADNVHFDQSVVSFSGGGLLAQLCSRTLWSPEQTQAYSLRSPPLDLRTYKKLNRVS